MPGKASVAMERRENDGQLWLTVNLIGANAVGAPAWQKSNSAAQCSHGMGVYVACCSFRLFILYFVDVGQG